jgi:sulfate permease, SulP family
MLLRNLAEPRVAELGRLADSHDYVDIERHPEARVIPGALITRPESPLFFATASASSRRSARDSMAPAHCARRLSVSRNPPISTARASSSSVS